MLANFDRRRCRSQTTSISLVWWGLACRQEVSGRRDVDVSPEESQLLNYPAMPAWWCSNNISETVMLMKQMQLNF